MKIFYPRFHKASGIESYSDDLILTLRSRGIEVAEEWVGKGKNYKLKTLVNSTIDLIFIENIDYALNFTHLKKPIVSVLHHTLKPQSIKEQAKASKIVVCVSEFSKSLIPEVKNSTVIINGVDTDFWTPNTNRIIDRTSISIISPNYGKFEKGTDIVNGLATLLDEYRFKIYVTSDTLKESRNPMIINKGRIYWEEMLDLYQQCDLVLFPTRFEGFGLVAAEGLACGLPVVSTVGTAVGEIIDDTTGRLCESGNYFDFRDAIVDLVEDETKYNAMRVECRNKALAKFTLNRMVDQYLDIFQKVIDKYY